MEDELSKPQAETKISFMTDIEPSEVRKQLEEQVEKKKIILKETELEKAQREFDKAEAKLRKARMDTEEFENFKEDELNRSNPDEDAEIVNIPQEIQVSKIEEKPENAEYLSFEELKQRVQKTKIQNETMLTEEEIVKLKKMLKGTEQKNDDVLNAEEMEKLQKLMQSTTKGAYISPTIAKMMPTYNIVASQKDIEKVLETAKEGTVIKDEVPQEIKGGEIPKGARILLDLEPEFLKAKKRCPKCNAKTKIKSKIINKEEGKFAKIKIRCKNTKRKWYWLWLKKPRCDYFEEYNERID
ncbi:hypothetical protein CCP3SC1AL1_520019 [Gammaproteobacteria bacterium]